MNNRATPPIPAELSEVLAALLQTVPEGDLERLTSVLKDTLSGVDLNLPPRLFFLAVEQSPVAISITDTRANILYANRAFGEVTGYAPAEVIGKNEAILSDKNTPKVVYQELWAALSAERPWVGRLVNRRRNGERYVADITIAPVMGAHGVVTHYLGMHRDFTQIHRLEQELGNQKLLNASVVDAAPVAILLIDEQGRVVRANQAYRQLAGGSDLAAELLTKLYEATGLSLRGGDESPGFSNQEIAVEVPGGGQRWLSCAGTRLAEHDVAADSFFNPSEQSYLLLVANDITAQKQQQETLRLSSLRALTAEQELVRGLRETLAGAIHQMEGPINMVGAVANMLARRGESCGDSHHLLEVLSEAQSQGRQAMERLRYSMPHAPTEPARQVNLNQVLRDVLSLFTRRLLSSGIEVDWQPALDLPPMTGREGLLRGMFKQLVDNAVDALEEQDAGLRELRIVTARDGDELEVLISDSGPGIPDPLRLKVFEPFFTTKTSAGHAGTGLGMAQDIVNEHAGTLHIDPDFRQGCRVSVRLPVQHQPIEEL